MSYRLILTSALLSALALPASAQDEGKVLYTVFQKPTPTLKQLDLATGKIATVLSDGSFCNGVSPKGTVLSTWNKSTRELSFRSGKDPQKVLYSMAKTFAWPCFLDEQTVVLPNYEGDPAAEAKFQLRQLNLKSGELRVLASFPHKSWDDVPLSLSPDRKKIVFFLRSGGRALHIYHVDSGKTGPLVEGGTILTWGPDSTHFLSFHKKDRSMTLSKLGKDGLSSEVVHSFGPGSIIGTWLSETQLIYARMGEELASLVVFDVKTKQETPVTSRFLPEEVTLQTVAVGLPGGGFLFTEMAEGKKALNLMRGDWKQGKLVKTKLATEEGLIGLPYRLP